MGTDITDVVMRYREALRFVWNNCIWVDPTLRHWDTLDALDQLKAPLFKAVVGTALDIEGERFFGPSFHLIPYDADGIPILKINMSTVSSPHAGSWQPIQGPFKEADITLVLVDLFDWTSFRCIDLQYYVALITDSRKHPDYVGRHVLVETMDARVLWTPESSEHDTASVEDHII